MTTKTRTLAGGLLLWAGIGCPAYTGEPSKSFGIRDEALALSRSMNTVELREYIEKRTRLMEQTARDLCMTAELMKYAGDGRATEYYQYSIQAAIDEPGYEMLFGDYLRINRGPGRPLFPQPEEHYLSGLRKARQAEKQSDLAPAREADRTATLNGIERGMIALYQRDGIPIHPGRLGIQDSAGPSVFFSTVNRYARATSDFDRVDDVRSFTSEAAFASSAARLGRPLTLAELQSIARTRNQFETFDRIRIRNGPWPVLDLFYRHREAQSAQITNFFVPGRLNDIKLDEFGVALERTFAAMPVGDLYFRAAYSRIRRQGIVEFLPNTRENVNQYQANVAWSRFIGRDKASVDMVYVYQDIMPDMASPAIRNRNILGITLDYLLLRPLPFLKPSGKRFELRGLDFFGGAAFDVEKYGATDVHRNDYFAGVSAKGLGRLDLTLQPTVFTSRVDGDPTQSNRQFRTNVNLRYRIVDEESDPLAWGADPNDRLSAQPRPDFFGLHPAFLHFVVPMSRDHALQGSNAFENYRIGAGFDAKFYTRGFPHDAQSFSGTSVLVSAVYSFQRFSRLNRDEHLFSLNLSIGF
ncbi:MAG: hypothetical protein B7Z37_25120 [Verrucomicrobia bacterium 12-59-8]|nr:MAG: hypothetical protein B7Z37_25120 [Verrucomicrobia bacterium 12-59-8]